MAREDEQRLKDLLRNIETGDIPEDLPDPEEYDDMGGIKSLDRGAPSIKMASETPEEEFELEIFMMLQEFEDAKKNGYGGSLEDFSKEYFTKRKMKKEEDRQMAMYGGRMQYADGNDRPYEMKDGQKKFINLPEKGYSTPFEAREAGDLEDRARYREIQSVEDKKGKPKPFKMDTEKVEALIKAAKEEKLKKAKGGVASILGD